MINHKSTIPLLVLSSGDQFDGNPRLIAAGVSMTIGVLNPDPI